MLATTRYWLAIMALTGAGCKAWFWPREAKKVNASYSVEVPDDGVKDDIEDNWQKYEREFEEEDGDQAKKEEAMVKTIKEATSNGGDVHIHIKTLIDGASLAKLWRQMPPLEDILLMLPNGDGTGRLARVVEEKYVTERLVSDEHSDEGYDHAKLREVGRAKAVIEKDSRAKWRGKRVVKKRPRKNKRRRRKRRGRKVNKAHFWRKPSFQHQFRYRRSRWNPRPFHAKMPRSGCPNRRNGLCGELHPRESNVKRYYGINVLPITRDESFIGKKQDLTKMKKQTWSKKIREILWKK